jgi:predicted PurR-regulated permease PerM
LGGVVSDGAGTTVSVTTGKLEEERRATDGAAEPRGGGDGVGQIAGRTAIVTLVVVGILVAALVLWKGRIVVALLFSAMIVAAAVRPSVEWLVRKRVPRGVGVVLHYAVLGAFLAVGLWLVVPAAADQVQAALGDQHQLRQAARG